MSAALWDVLSLSAFVLDDSPEADNDNYKKECLLHVQCLDRHPGHLDRSAGGRMGVSDTILISSRTMNKQDKKIGLEIGHWT